MTVTLPAKCQIEFRPIWVNLSGRMVLKMRRVKKSHILAAACLVLLWSVAASAQEIKYNFMPGTDFSKYKTYKWARLPNAQYTNHNLATQTRQPIDSQPP